MGCLLVNGYAATESDTICQYVMGHETVLAANRVPVGSAVDGISVMILDDAGRDTVGAIGEIAVEGKTLATGFWNAKNQTIVPLRRASSVRGILDTGWLTAPCSCRAGATSSSTYTAIRLI